jgi:YgiT-type zinc finger domain-containing protein
MSKCDVCGGTNFRDELITEVFEINGKRVLVKNIPARICIQCGEPIFSSETTEKVRRMVHGESQPIEKETLDVYAFVQ